MSRHERSSLGTNVVAGGAAAAGGGGGGGKKSGALQRDERMVVSDGGVRGDEPPGGGGRRDAAPDDGALVRAMTGNGEVSTATRCSTCDVAVAHISVVTTPDPVVSRHLSTGRPRRAARPATWQSMAATSISIDSYDTRPLRATSSLDRSTATRCLRRSRRRGRTRSRARRTSSRA